MAGQTVAAPDEWVDDEWVDVPPSPVNNKASRRGDLDPTLRAMGLSDADISALDALDAKQPNAATNLSMLGGLLGPVGAGAGAAAGTLLEGGSAKDAATSGAINWAIPAGMEKAIGALRQPVANLLRRSAVRPMMSAMKIDRGALEKLPGVRRKGIAKAERDIAQFAIDENVNPVKANRGLVLRGSRGLDDGIEEKLNRTSAARLRRAERAPDKPIQGGAANVESKLDDVAQWAGKGDAPQKRVAAVKALSDDVRTNPSTSDVVVSGVGYSAPRNPAGRPQLRASHDSSRDVRQLRDLTPLEEVSAIKANNELLSKAYKDGLTSPDVKVRRAVQAARTENLDRAAGTKKLSQRMRDLINLKAVGNVATRRADASNPFSLVDAVSMQTGRTGILAASVAMKSPVLAELSLALNRAGKSVGTPSERAEALRRILVAYLANQGGDK